MSRRVWALEARWPGSPGFRPVELWLSEINAHASRRDHTKAERQHVPPAFRAKYRVVPYVPAKENDDGE